VGSMFVPGDSDSGLLGPCGGGGAFGWPRADPCVVRLDAKRGRIHRLSIDANRNGRKRPKPAFGGEDFKPIQADFKPATNAACDHTKRPEVKAPQPVAVECRKSRRGLARGDR